MFPGLSALRTQLAEFGECTSHIVLSDFPGLHMDVSELFPHLSPLAISQSKNRFNVKVLEVAVFV